MGRGGQFTYIPTISIDELLLLEYHVINDKSSMYAFKSKITWLCELYFKECQGHVILVTCTNLFHKLCYKQRSCHPFHSTKYLRLITFDIVDSSHNVSEELIYQCRKNTYCLHNSPHEQQRKRNLLNLWKSLH